MAKQAAGHRIRGNWDAIVWESVQVGAKHHKPESRGCKSNSKMLRSASNTTSSEYGKGLLLAAPANKSRL